MTELSAEIRLRPTRIGFLVSPTDLAAVRAVMRACAGLWGGVFNPIIPVFRRAPPEWRGEPGPAVSGPQIARGYVRFFEPDVYVEVTEGLLEKAGLAALRQQNALRKPVMTLGEFMKPEHDGGFWEPPFGLGVYDALVRAYKTEHRFVLREKRDSIYVLAEHGTACAEAVFGVFPTAKPVEHIKKAYQDVFRPENVKPGPNAWRQSFLKGARTPLRAIRQGLEVNSQGFGEAAIFVFDASRATDLIDLWNRRIEPGGVLPVPLAWLGALTGDLRKIIAGRHRAAPEDARYPARGTAVEFGRSIPRATAETLWGKLAQGLPTGAASLKLWSNRVWEEPGGSLRGRTRLPVIADERRIRTVPLGEGRHRHLTFESLAPGWAAKYGRGDCRWANVLRLSAYGASDVATALPFNTFDRVWPRLGLGGDPTLVGSEGWVFPQQFAGHDQLVSLPAASDALVGWLEQHGIKAQHSDPGRVARQMLEHLGGFSGARLLADPETLKLLNRMAGGVRKRKWDGEEAEETFGLRTAPLKEWADLVSKRRSRQDFPQIGLEDFTRRNVIRLGLETDCAHCQARNWASLTAADYRLTCERCLKQYDFPQGSLRGNNRNFAYRVVGPFSVPDFGRGSYGALLALRALWGLDMLGGMTFSTATDLSWDGIQQEVDFIAWCGDGGHFGARCPPTLVIGEAKSFGDGELVTAADLAKLRKLAAWLPEAVFVVSVLRDHFTANEKQILQRFVAWARHATAHQQPAHPVILLTGRELMMPHHNPTSWRSLGGP